MRLLIIMLAVLLGLFTGCEPNIAPKVPIAPAPPIADTTSPVIPAMVEKTFSFSLLDSAKNVYVMCNSLTSEFPIEQLDEVVMRITPEKELYYLRVNNKVFLEKRMNNYRYNTKGDVIVSQGNIALNICRDHDISMEDFKRWNPGVNVEKLKLNQLVHVADNTEN